jgi:TetR/AcrR family transcriptional regulator
VGSETADAESPLRPPGKLPPGPGMAARDVAAHQLARIHSATIGIVAERGYESLKVRDVVSYAEVSTRAFYELFGSKEDCFLRTYELISRRATRRILAAQAGERDWRVRSELIFEEFLRGLGQRPEDARLALIEAYRAGEASREAASRAERIFEGMLAEAFARAPGGIAVPPLVIEGMVAGIAAVSRRCLLEDRLAELSDARGELIEWALSYPDRTAGELERLDRESIWRDTTLEPLLVDEGESARGDRALILTAVAELASNAGYESLTAPRIRSAAGVSRKKFNAYFDDVEDCWLAALEQRAGQAIAQASRAQAAASSREGGVYRAIAALCEHVASDKFLTRVCLTNDFPPGPDGRRSRRRLIEAVTELLAPPEATRPASFAADASAGAVWSVFRRHVVENRTTKRRAAGTLSYLALAPVAGAPATVAAIRGEQGG